MNKPALRNALKKLRAVPFDQTQYSNVAMAPQEVLDFLAMLVGMKPVFLLGRGFDDAQWIEGVIGIARSMKLHVIAGPQWHAGSPHRDVPQWFHGWMHPAEAAESVFYICRARANAEAVSTSMRNPPITAEDEARLLNYPVCCVRFHYDRDALFEHGFYMMVERTAGGRIEEMQRILREDVQMKPETQEEIAALERAKDFTPAPFTSFNMCEECAADPSRPASQTSKRYENLARTLDASLAAEIASIHEQVKRHG